MGQEEARARGLGPNFCPRGEAQPRFKKKVLPKKKKTNDRESPGPVGGKGGLVPKRDLIGTRDLDAVCFPSEEGTSRRQKKKNWERARRVTLRRREGRKRAPRHRQRGTS